MTQYLQLKHMRDEELEKADFVALEVEARALDEKNEVIYQEDCEKVRTIHKLTSDLYMAYSNTYRYVKKNIHVYRPKSNMETVRAYKDRLESLRSVAETKLRKELEAKDAVTKTEGAILFLQARGKVLGTDFTLTDAIIKATEIKLDEIIKQTVSKGVIFSFDGDDTCEDCTGWDGVSHRCNCGNRRVSWSWSGDYTDLYIYGEAY
jgi:hypothetical protein